MKEFMMKRYKYTKGSDIHYEECWVSILDEFYSHFTGEKTYKIRIESTLSFSGKPVFEEKYISENDLKKEYFMVDSRHSKYTSLIKD